MEPRMDREPDWGEPLFLDEFRVALVRRRARRAYTRPAKRTLRGETKAFKQEAVAQLKPFATGFVRELLKMVGIQ